MIVAYLIVAGVGALAALFLGIVHHFWLGKSLNEKAAQVRHRKGARKRETLVERINGRRAADARLRGVS
jgi:hypothetical protein